MNIHNFAKNTLFPEVLKFDFCAHNPKICENLPPNHAEKGSKRAKKSCFQGLKRAKMQFYFTEYQAVARKMQKKFKKVGSMWWVCYKNTIFAIPNDDDMRGTERGVVNRGMFIERMKECSKYSRDRNLRFASDEARTDNLR